MTAWELICATVELIHVLALVGYSAMHAALDEDDAPRGRGGVRDPTRTRRGRVEAS